MTRCAAFISRRRKGKRGEAYNLCATRTVSRSARSCARRSALSGVKAEIRPVPRLMRPSDERIIFGSTQKIRKDTGWKPLNSLEQTLSSMMEYWNAGHVISRAGSEAVREHELNRALTVNPKAKLRRDWMPRATRHACRSARRRDGDAAATGTAGYAQTAGSVSEMRLSLSCWSGNCDRRESAAW